MEALVVHVNPLAYAVNRSSCVVVQMTGSSRSSRDISYVLRQPLN